jgi:hypothetical protein
MGRAVAAATLLAAALLAGASRSSAELQPPAEEAPASAPAEPQAATRPPSAPGPAEARVRPQPRPARPPASPRGAAQAEAPPAGESATRLGRPYPLVSRPALREGAGESPNQLGWSFPAAVPSLSTPAPRPAPPFTVAVVRRDEGPSRFRSRRMGTPTPVASGLVPAPAVGLGLGTLEETP